MRSSTSCGARVAAVCVAALGLLVALTVAGTAHAGSGSPYYKELRVGETVYVFVTPERYRAFAETGQAGQCITLASGGPNGETVIAEDQAALDLFLRKYGPATRGRAPARPDSPLPGPTVKFGEGELRVGLLFQPWYVSDSSPAGNSTSYLGNTVGFHTFRVRRAEVRLSGTINPSWGFEVMFDPAKTQTFVTSVVPVTDDKILQDLAVSYLGLKGHEFLFGQRKVALTEEGLRSPAELEFVERARVMRSFGDRRELGLFYRGAPCSACSAWASVTNGTVSNVPDNDNSFFVAGRFDLKPTRGLTVGASGGTTAGGRPGYLKRDLLGGHVRLTGFAGTALGFEVEYLKGTLGQAGKADLRQDGYYGSVFYTFAGVWQVALRYDEMDPNTDLEGDAIRTLAAGFNYLLKGKNVKLMLDHYNVEEQGRTVNGVRADRYSQIVFQAQIAF